jgi:transcriptional regulator with GAF, ATPase, and Fis domain
MGDHAAPLRAALSGKRNLAGLIGEPAPMRRLCELIGKIGLSKFPGSPNWRAWNRKEVVARAIHFTGLRREQALVPVDCSALTPTLVQSELFGQVKSAVTGADRSKLRLLQAANEGAIFLDSWKVTGHYRYFGRDR